MIVINDGKTRIQHPGYSIEADGSLKLMPFMIDETYSQKHEVWLINFNERAENPEEYKNPKKFMGRQNGAGEYMAQLRFPDLGIVEDWVDGAVELRLKVFNSSNASEIWNNRLGISHHEQIRILRSWVTDNKWWLPYYWMFSWYSESHGSYIIMQ